MENTIKIAKLQENMKEMNRKLDDLDTKIDTGFSDIKKDLSCYVRREEFATVKSVVYGMVGAILSAFIASIIYMVFK